MVEHVTVAGVVVVVFVVVVVALTMSPPPMGGGLIGIATDNHKYHTPHPLAALADPTAASPPFGGCVLCVGGFVWQTFHVKFGILKKQFCVVELKRVGG